MAERHAATTQQSKDDALSYSHDTKSDHQRELSELKDSRQNSASTCTRTAANESSNNMIIEGAMTRTLNERDEARRDLRLQLTSQGFTSFNTSATQDSATQGSATQGSTAQSSIAQDSATQDSNGVVHNSTQLTTRHNSNNCGAAICQPCTSRGILSPRALAGAESMGTLERIYVGLQRLAFMSDLSGMHGSVATIVARLIADVSSLERELNARQCFHGSRNEEQTTDISQDLLAQTCRLLQQENTRLLCEMEEMRLLQFMKSADSPISEVSKLTQPPEGSTHQTVHWLRSYANELKMANHRWAAHCEALERDHATQLLVMRSRATAAEKCIREITQSAGERRSHDQRVTAVHSHVPQVESARDGTKQDCCAHAAMLVLQRDSEHRHVDSLRAAVVQLQEELAATQAAMRPAGAAKHTTTKEPFALPTMSCENCASQATMTAMRVEIQILQQQLSIFKKDFDRENAERQQAVKEVDDLRTQLSQITFKWHASEQEVSSLKAQLATALSDKSNLEQQICKKVATLHRAQQRDLSENPQNSGSTSQPARCHENTVFSGCRPLQYTVMSPPSLFESWHCVKCTYHNESTRTVCEICNAKAPVNSGCWIYGTREASYSELMAREARGSCDSSSDNGKQDTVLSYQP